jgi:cytochrome c peroxidase
MKKISFYALSILTILIYACGGGSKQSQESDSADLQVLTEEAHKIAKSNFGTLPLIAESSKNEITEEKVLLGRLLYFDTRLSKNGNISCNSCHALNNFGVDNEPTSPGDDGIRGGRNTPTVFNAALHAMQFWDGRAADVEEQAGMPILNPIEHGIPDQKFLEKRLSEIPMYQDLFAKAFPGEKNPITFQNLSHAIAAFERKLITPARIDKFIAGDMDALNEQEKRGIKVFAEAGCNTCHIGPAAGGMLMQKFGVFGDYWEETKSAKVDEGRFEVTENESDKYIFKVPSLRNIEKTFPYFHDGSVADLGEAVRIMAKLQQNKELTKEQIEDLVAFLKTMTGDIPEELKTPPTGFDLKS